MATYAQQPTAETMQLRELNLDGSARLRMLKANTIVYPRPSNQTPLDLPALGFKQRQRP